MSEIHPNFDAVKRGLIELTPQERLKLEKDGLDVIHDIYRYAKQSGKRSPRRLQMQNCRTERYRLSR